MSEVLKLYTDENRHAKDLQKLQADMSSISNGHEVNLVCSAISSDQVIGENSEIEILTQMHHSGHTHNFMWPNKFEGHAAVWSIDEEFAAYLTGMVLSIRPKVVLETGTNKGRSTRAIVDGLTYNDALNEKGVIYTIDLLDYKIKSSGAIPKDQIWRVNCLIGNCPDVFDSELLRDLEDIDFAFLDGDHTQEVVEQELEYVDAHRADECIVVVHNARDEQWGEVEQFFKSYDKYPHISLPVLTGAEIIQMR